MYDSRSSHPRNGVHILRARRKEDDDRLPVRPTLTKDRMLTEQIAALVDEDAPAKPGLKRLRNQGFGELVCEVHIEASGLARWEAELLGICDRDCQYVWSRSLGMTEAEAKRLEEEEAEAEGLDEARMLTESIPPSQVGLPEHTVWSSDLTDQFWAEVDQVRDEMPEPEYVDDADLDYAAWPAGATISEVYDALGDGFLIEGPGQSWCEQRNEHYVRVYELAREIGCEASDLVRFLRHADEYVKSHLSMVALPVADYFKSEEVGIGAWLAQTFPRKERPLTWAQECAAWRDRKW